MTISRREKGLAGVLLFVALMSWGGHKGWTVWRELDKKLPVIDENRERIVVLEQARQEFAVKLAENSALLQESNRLTRQLLEKAHGRKVR